MSIKEAFNQLQLIADDLDVLDSSLRLLFKDAPDTAVTEHQQLVHFRSRVARRITRYGQLTKRMASIIEQLLEWNDSIASSDVDRPASNVGLIKEQQRQELCHLHRQHQKRLQTYKAQFADWWQRTERHFHTMRMASYLCSMQEKASLQPDCKDRHPSDANTENSAHNTQVLSDSGSTRCGQPIGAETLGTVQCPPSSATDRVMVARQPRVSTVDVGLQGGGAMMKGQMLRDSRQAMAQEVQRMQATREQLQHSSTTLEQAEGTYHGLRLMQGLFGSRSSSSWAVAHSS